MIQDAKEKTLVGDKYKIVLIDLDGYLLGAEREAATLPQAKDWMAYLLSDAYAEKVVESTHSAMNTFKAEIRTKAGECVADAFYPQ